MLIHLGCLQYICHWIRRLDRHPMAYSLINSCAKLPRHHGVVHNASTLHRRRSNPSTYRPQASINRRTYTDSRSPRWNSILSILPSTTSILAANRKSTSPPKGETKKPQRDNRNCAPSQKCAEPQNYQRRLNHVSATNPHAKTTHEANTSTIVINLRGGFTIESRHN